MTNLNIVVTTRLLQLSMHMISEGQLLISHKENRI